MMSNIECKVEVLSFLLQPKNRQVFFCSDKEAKPSRHHEEASENLISV
jgi:hypothetical protein